MMLKGSTSPEIGFRANRAVIHVWIQPIRPRGKVFSIPKLYCNHVLYGLNIRLCGGFFAITVTSSELSVKQSYCGVEIGWFIRELYAWIRGWSGLWARGRRRGMCIFCYPCLIYR